MERLNVSIIGCGIIFGVHADAVSASLEAKLVSVVDIEENRAKEAAEKYNCDYFLDYHQVLNDEKVDIVHICTPHYLHAPMAIAALKADKHVLVEKPIAINVEQAEEMIRIAKESKKYLGVVFQNRYNSTSIEAKKILTEGTLGKIKGSKGIVTWYRDASYYQSEDWRGKWSTEGGGILINQSIHTLDLLQWLTGEIKAIKGHVDTRLLQDVIEVEDTADATLFFEDNKRALFYATNCYTTNSPIELEVHCEKGTLRIAEEELIIKEKGQSKVIANNQSLDGEKSYWGASHKKLIIDFYRQILEGKKDYIDGKEGITSLKIIEGIYQSSKSGQKFKL